MCDATMTPYAQQSATKPAAGIKNFPIYLNDTHYGQKKMAKTIIKPSVRFSRNSIQILNFEKPIVYHKGTYYR
jgi:hypothetical protein